jgi:hypothetical protein
MSDPIDHSENPVGTAKSAAPNSMWGEAFMAVVLFVVTMAGVRAAHASHACSATAFASLQLVPSLTCSFVLMQTAPRMNSTPEEL